MSNKPNFVLSLIRDGKHVLLHHGLHVDGVKPATVQVRVDGDPGAAQWDILSTATGPGERVFESSLRRAAYQRQDRRYFDVVATPWEALPVQACNHESQPVHQVWWAEDPEGDLVLWDWDRGTPVTVSPLARAQHGPFWGALQHALDQPAGFKRRHGVSAGLELIRQADRRVYLCLAPRHWKELETASWSEGPAFADLSNCLPGAPLRDLFVAEIEEDWLSGIALRS